LQNLRTHQIKINTWTINDQKDMRKAIEMKLDGVITNHPDTFARILQEYQAQ
jgi:glycerophosphoryl diester phosphodiesterase